MTETVSDVLPPGGDRQTAAQDDVVLSRGVYMTFVGETPHGGMRGRAWHYMIDRFQRDVRLELPILFDKYQGLETDPRTGLEIPSGILFEEHPADKGYHWYYHEVDGLYVPTLRTFVDNVNAALDAKDNPTDKAKVLRAKLGLGVGIAILSHLDRTADHFLDIAEATAQEG